MNINIDEWDLCCGAPLKKGAKFIAVIDMVFRIHLFMLCIEILIWLMLDVIFFQIGHGWGKNVFCGFCTDSYFAVWKRNQGSCGQRSSAISRSSTDGGWYWKWDLKGNSYKQIVNLVSSDVQMVYKCNVLCSWRCGSHDAYVVCDFGIILFTCALSVTWGSRGTYTKVASWNF